MKFTLATLSLVLFSVVDGKAIPPFQGPDGYSLVPRNATVDSAELASTSGQGIYDITPHPFGAPCGMTWDVTISVKDAGDQTKASPLCKYLHTYITLPTSQGISDKKVNFIYLCPPQWPTPISPEGYGYHDIKFIVTGLTMFPSGDETVNANLNVVNIHTIPPTNTNIPVKIGYYFDVNNPNKPGFKMLTFRSIACAK
ncbi:hypothetical protein A1O7_07883 [Cladophialophora yegresii CBS 114405]|uniref:Ubiquitin 3 binding protein But2 C-terminal domain-containing protein n=1 Tax=Cladophialophora yegresii CBS 114405 TaxID=1182544 RepID=W9VXV0_9EURO|nr:uncharacterized protein A1O7_07883 [Cladophialophora yegresii CBS 114405]EXJ57535.1 hypothetical protein A1O7_07883 [Cladophialophora yegresii CBS 114405]